MMTITHAHASPAPVTDWRLSFLWAEVTGRCQLSCTHCYAGSGPDGTHGIMTPGRWERVLTDAAALGTEAVSFTAESPPCTLSFPASFCTR
jgi:molybdenum cofactor biosynthesis enzyme MoaA